MTARPASPNCQLDLPAALLLLLPNPSPENLPLCFSGPGCVILGGLFFLFAKTCLSYSPSRGVFFFPFFLFCVSCEICCVAKAAGGLLRSRLSTLRFFSLPPKLRRRPPASPNSPCQPRACGLILVDIGTGCFFCLCWGKYFSGFGYWVSGWGVSG